MSGGGFYDAGPLKQLAVNLFYGWGYNFYRLENQLRADDQLVRAKAGLILAQARSSLETAEAAFRRERLPAPSRAHPLPEPEAVAGAAALERLGKAVSVLASRLNSLPVPENDRMTQRYRQEAQTLQALGACDEQLIGQAETLRLLLNGRTADAMLENAAAIEAGVAAIAETLRQRALILT
jgi:hypothetical protein